jgi:deazaflavin-dependent oxidoreductase (nitroreductase family)
VIGRKSGRTISIPVWFVLEGEKLYLLPVQGSETQWYKNVLQNPSIRIDARGAEAEFRAAPVRGAKAVSSIVEKFREKYVADYTPMIFDFHPPKRSHSLVSKVLHIHSICLIC